MRPGRGQAPPPSGPQIVIKITSSHGFDGNEIANTLAKKLGIQNYNFSQNNQSATINLSYSGTVESVATAIDFGSVGATDEATKTITVTIP